MVLFLIPSLYFKLILNDRAHSLLVNRFFLIVEFILLSEFFACYLRLKAKHLIKVVSCFLFVIFSFIDYYTTKSPIEFSFMPLVVECLFFVLVIVYFFYEKLQYSVATPILHTAEFWISVAFLLFFSGNFFLFLFSKSSLNDPGFREQYVVIYGSVTIIKDVLLSVAIVIRAYLNEGENRLGKSIDIDLGSFYPLNKNTNPKPQ